jgi:prevent-host-death family protein
MRIANSSACPQACTAAFGEKRTIRPRIDFDLYIMYSWIMKRATSKGVEAARREFPAILDAAAKGGTTVITRRGVAVAAVVPASAAAKSRPISLLSLAGSGKGLWGSDPSKTVARLRDEWAR